MPASGGVPAKTQLDSFSASGGKGAVVAIKTAADFDHAVGIEINPEALAKMTVPLAVRLPQIFDGLVSDAVEHNRIGLTVGGTWSFRQVVC